MTIDGAKAKLDEAVSAYSTAVREDSVLSGYYLVYMATDYSEVGTGSAWYDWATLPGQPHHSSEGLLAVGKSMLDRNFWEGSSHD